MLRPIVTFLVFASLAGSLAFGQGGHAGTGKIEGKLVLPGGGLAVGANVLLRDTRIGTSVGEDGTFVLAGLKPGTYVVMASLVAYELVAPATVSVRAGETARVELQLRPEALELGKSR